MKMKPLTLKKVKIKRSAKKLILQATLKSMAKWPKVKESSLNSKAKHTMQKPTRKVLLK